MRIAITGAAGFVGSALLRAAREGGHQTVALTRRDLDVRGANITARIASIDDPPSVRLALEGADAVVHLAARVHVMDERAPNAAALYQLANVEGTKVVLESAIAAGVRRFVSMSTAKVHGEGGERPYTEDDTLEPLGPYATTKRDAEECVAGAAARIGWTILRPPLVYGAGVGGNFRRLLALAALGARLPLPLGGLRNRRSLVHVGNLADAVMRVLGDDRAVGRRYLVSDGEDLSTTDLLRRLGTAMGVRPMLLPVPGTLLKAALALVGRRGEGQRLTESFVVDSSRIRRELGWAAPFTVDQGLAETTDWWRRSPSGEAPQ